MDLPLLQTLLVLLAAFFGAALTLFSGFGLGTLLLAVFLLFFPPGIAVAVTAVVHLLNNLFKFALLGRHTDLGVLLKFGLPAFGAAWAGAMLLNTLTTLEPLLVYQFASRTHEITPVKLAIGVLLLAFALLESFPQSRLPEMKPALLPIGGMLSGFFGGLSGHQGALRSLFLVKAGLGKESFIATGVAIALLIDVSRLATYFTQLRQLDLESNLAILVLATLAAFAGSFLASRWLKKTTFRQVQLTVVSLLLVIAVGLISGLL